MQAANMRLQAVPALRDQIMRSSRKSKFSADEIKAFLVAAALQNRGTVRYFIETKGMHLAWSRPSRQRG
jgi:hypothetical protein